MKRMLPTLAIAAAVVGLGGPPSYAAEYNIRVPVNLQSLSPEVRAIDVFCRLLTNTNVQIQLASRPRNITPPSFTATVEIPISVPASETRVPTKYECWIHNIKVQIGTGTLTTYQRYPVWLATMTTGPMAPHTRFGKSAGDWPGPADFPINTGAAATMVVAGPIPQ